MNQKLATSELISKSATPKRAIVIFDTRYGNTEKIAKSLEAGLRESGIQTACVNAKEATLESLKEYDLIAVGAPTEWLSASKPMKEFLGKLESADLSGRYGFAFDTKLERPLSGSAGKHIEKEMKKLGLESIAPRESAAVFGTSSSMSSMTLKEGEDKKFEQIGLQVGTALLAKGRKIPT